MKKYLRCHMVEVQPMTRGAYNKKQGRPLPYDTDECRKGIKRLLSSSEEE